MKYTDAKKVKVGDTVLYGGFPGMPKKVIAIKKPHPHDIWFELEGGYGERYTIVRKVHEMERLHNGRK